MNTKVAINGFGRIGRVFLRSVFSHPNIEVVAINDIADIQTMAHLLKYDSTHGILNLDVSCTSNSIVLDNKEIKYFSQKDPANLPWSSLDVDVVVEC